MRLQLPKAGNGSQCRRNGNRETPRRADRRLRSKASCEHEGFRRRSPPGIMEANGLRQENLAEDLGGESIVSLILQEKRQLNRPDGKAQPSVSRVSRRFLLEAVSGVPTTG